MALRHLGIWRDVTADEARLDKTVLKRLFRHGSRQQEGILANRCQTRLSAEAWQKCMDRLAEWKMIGFDFNHGDEGSRLVSLGVDGRDWALELTCSAQIEQQDEEERIRVENNRKERGW
jgi:hypothetical protein